MRKDFVTQVLMKSASLPVYPKKTFYQTFSDKYDLHEKLIAFLFEMEFTSSAENESSEWNAEQHLLNYLQIYIDTCFRHPVILERITINRKSQNQLHIATPFVAKCILNLEEILVSGIANKEFRIHDVQTTSWIILHLIDDAVRITLEQDGDMEKQGKILNSVTSFIQASLTNTIVNR